MTERILKLAELNELLIDADRYGTSLFTQAKDLYNYFHPLTPELSDCKCTYDTLIAKLRKFWSESGQAEFEN